MSDNTFTIYTSSGSTFNVNKDSDYNKKTIMPVWFNKSDQNKYIGFSDGVYDFLESNSEPVGKDYDEDDYMLLSSYYNNAMSLDQTSLQSKGIPSVQELLQIYSYGLKIQSKLESLNTQLAQNVNSQYARLKSVLRNNQSTSQREATDAAYLNVIASNGAYANAVTYLETLKADEDVSGSFMADILDSLIKYGKVYIGELSISSVDATTIVNDLSDKITTLSTKLSAARSAADVYFNTVQSQVDDGVMAIWDNTYQSCKTIYDTCEEIVTAIQKIVSITNPG